MVGRIFDLASIEAPRDVALARRSRHILPDAPCFGEREQTALQTPIGSRLPPQNCSGRGPSRVRVVI